ncbi:hypothetical protein CRG98_046325 [Punica granatum]|nr:hypothetical protein CRG98_046325 [Punica granatum]
MRGRVEVVKELIISSPDPTRGSLQQTLEGDSVLHLCVKYNQLDALKVLVNSLAEDNEDLLLNSRDAEGNTMFHLAVLLKQEETVRFLLSVPTVREGSASALPEDNSIALNVMHQSPGNFKSVGKREQMSRCWDKLVVPLVNYPTNWIEDTRGSLMTVATLIAGITFDSVLSPPGGVWQEDTTTGFTCSRLKRDDNITCLAGNAVAAYYDEPKYRYFMVCNTMAFMGSLSVLFLLISGFPPKNKFWMWVLTMIVCITVSFLGFTFIIAMILVSPDQALSKLRVVIRGSLSSWSTLVGILVIFNAVILAYLILKWTKSRRSAARTSRKAWAH